MTTEERRQGILQRLRGAETPVTGSGLAKAFHVSRQIIVGDINILRAEGHGIIATQRGYRLLREDEQDGMRAAIVCRHNAAGMDAELKAIVDNGGKVLDVIVEHPLYGTLRGDLFLASRRDIRAFMEKMHKTKAEPLSTVTDGVHIHTIQVADADALEAIQDALYHLGILVE